MVEKYNPTLLRAYREEHKSWVEMCKKIRELMKISDIEFNERKDIKELCQKIANWGYYQTKLGVYFFETGQEENIKPLFCTVEE